MKPQLSEETKEYIHQYLKGVHTEQSDTVMDKLFIFGAYYQWGEDNYGKHCRDNTVYGFLSNLEALVEEISK